MYIKKLANEVLAIRALINGLGPVRAPEPIQKAKLQDGSPQVRPGTEGRTKENKGKTRVSRLG